MPQLDFATFPSQFLWLFLIFALQYIIMAKVIVPGFKKIYRTRQNFIDKEVAQAEDLIKKAEKLKADYEKKILEAKETHSKTLNQTVSKLQKTFDDKIEEIETSLAKDFKAQEKEMQSLEKSIKKELEEITLQSAATIISKLTKEEVKPTSLSKYVN